MEGIPPFGSFFVWLPEVGEGPNLGKIM